MNMNAYFPGGNTTKGFYSYYDSITNPTEASYIYTIKGGPGVGKSTFMKKIAKEFETLGFKLKYYHCSSDPKSLDGIFIEKINILFTDGTAPHIIDPKFPGCVDKIINLGDFLDEKMLKENKFQIIETTKAISGLFTSAYDYLEGITPLYHNLNKIYEKALLRDKFNSSVKALIKEITDVRKGNGFKNKKLFLSAITPEGRINFINHTIDTSTVYILNSEPGDLTPLYMKKLSEELEMRDFSFESYYCPIAPEDKIEHIIIPELDTSIVTSNKYHKFEIHLCPRFNKSLYGSF